jgi:hypothetical protein
MDDLRMTLKSEMHVKNKITMGVVPLLKHSFGTIK